MNGRVLVFGKTAHRQAAELLPWYASGKLDDEQRALVDTHLRGCAECRQDLEWQEEFRRNYADSGTAVGAEQGFALLERRMDDPFRLGSWLRRHFVPVLVAQCAVIVLLAGSVLVRDAAPETYRTLAAGAKSAAGAQAQADIVVAFDPSVREQDLRRIVRSAGARIVGGPTSTGGYLLAAGSVGEEATLRLLRSQNGVRLAESLHGTAPP
jgi:anti-sigma factor RsiW